MVSELESVVGIGKKTADQLLAEYKSWKKIKEAPLEALIKIVGVKRATLIKEHQ